MASSTDDGIGLAFPPFRVNELVNDQGSPATEKWKLSIQYKSNVSNASGFYARVYEYDAELPNDKITISNAATNPVVQEDSRRALLGWLENQPISQDWQTSTYTYTPTSTARWASVVLLNWTGMGLSELYYRDLIKREISGSGGGGNTAIDIQSIPENNSTFDYFPIFTDGTGQRQLSIKTLAPAVTYRAGNAETGGFRFSNKFYVTTNPFFGNSPNISADRTITSSFNEMSIGPVTITTGVTVTIQAGATFTVI